MLRSGFILQLALLTLCAGCAPRTSTAEAVVVYYGMQARAFVATPDGARTRTLEAFEGLGYDILESGPERLVARSLGTTKFFAMVGEQTKWHEVTAEFAPAPGGRVRIDLDAVLVHGPAGGGAVTRAPETDGALYEELFEAIHAALRARIGSVE